MSTISASTTSTTAYKVTADTTGTLVFQTGATPTTAMTLGSDQSVTFAGAQTYTGAATFSSGITVQGITVGRGASSLTNNTAVGASALQANTTGNQITSIGKQAAYANTTGNDNTFVGYSSGYSNTTGSSNTVVGKEALASNTTANYNIAVGFQAGYSNTTGVGSLFIGRQAGYTSNSTGAAGNNQVANTVIGDVAGYSMTTGYGNTIVGASAAYSLTTGIGNTIIGPSVSGVYPAGYYMTTGSKNTIIGSYSGNQGGLDIRTASNYIVLSDGDGSPRAWESGASAGWFQANNSASWRTSSDERIKENIVDVANGLNTILALRPVEFDYKIRDKRHDAGFIAQEYRNILPWQVDEQDNVSGEVAECTEGQPVLGIQQNLVPYLVKAIQELKAELDSNKREFDAYKEAHP